ncbi:MAG: SPFH domain-containing protein [Patescibacteria group bacterium]|jgi:uncharacterized membrane protein YqiK
MQWITPQMLALYAGVAFLALLILPSIRVIGPTEVGLVTKRFGFKELPDENPIAFKGEAGFQSDLLLAGWHFKLWIVYGVQKFPWVQVPAGQIGVVVAQLGQALPPGAKSAAYKQAFGNFTDPAAFVQHGGQKGAQRHLLMPGTSLPIHPAAFMVITKERVYGLPISPELERKAGKNGLRPEVFGLEATQLDLVQIGPVKDKEGKDTDMIGIVTALEGDPLPPTDIACRLGGFTDLGTMMQGADCKDSDLSEALLGSQNKQHNNYQNFQAFLDAGGKIGVQHDPLLSGAYALNPFLVRVERVPMLVVNQGEVAVVKAFVGLMTEDVSGAGYKHGSLVRPGRRGIWEEPLRTGKYALNPRCYQVEIVPTAILTLNWAEAVSKAHNFDSGLSQIDAKSREGFEFAIDLQVQIHVPDTNASRVIAAVGTMHNLVNEVLQAAVGNHFRDKLQGLPAIKFIETRQEIQVEAFAHIKQELAKYDVETRGVYIQDVVQPKALIDVLTEREIANQKIATYKKEQEAEETRVAMEQAKGKADMQAKLAQSTVQVDIETNNANALRAKAGGESNYIETVGAAEAAKIKARGLAEAAGYQAQKDAIGPQATAIVNAIQAIADGKVNIMPEVLVVGGGGGAFEALASVVTQAARSGNVPGLGKAQPVASAAPLESGSNGKSQSGTLNG